LSDNKQQGTEWNSGLDVPESLHTKTGLTMLVLQKGLFLSLSAFWLDIEIIGKIGEMNILLSPLMGAREHCEL
jgi:hypothetical protein